MNARTYALRRHLIAGLVVIAPVTITAVVIWWIFQRLDNLIGRFLYPLLPFPIPGLGLLALLTLLISVGWLAERAIGSRAITAWNGLLDRIPLLSRLYGAANRITRTVFDEDSRPFSAVVLIEYPAPGRHSIGFLSADAPSATQLHVPDAVTVFVPKTPNVATGMLVVVPRASLIVLPMSVDEAFTYLLSLGSVRPEGEAENEKMRR